MKQRIDLERAAEAEAFGALAVGARRKRRGRGVTGKPFTPAQSRALSDMARSLVQIARDAGAEHRRVVVSDVSFELRENGAEEVLSIRTGTGS
jgi:cytochrome P450